MNALEGGGPVSPRYFYPASRAHHAYCMAIDFGMEFEKRFGKWTRDGLLSLTGVMGYKLFIHPDSLSLLEPRAGDLMTNCGVLAWQLNAVTRDTLHFTDGQGELRGKKSEMSIVQRNGKPFHWPEHEAA